MQKKGELLKHFKILYTNLKFDFIKENRRVNRNLDFNNLNREKIE